MPGTAVVNHQDAFAMVCSMITEAQSKAWRQVNNTLIELYWNIGQYVSERVNTNGWGKGIVEEMVNTPCSRGWGHPLAELRSIEK